jgi:uncharacterized protein
MRCPVDGTTLALAERAGVEIDYCPQCRGVWLDRGELDRIVERSGGGYERERSRDDYRDHHDHDHDRRHDEDDEYRGGRYEQPRRKRGGAFTALTDLLGGGGD